jgi:hypothetical protein
MSGTETLAVQFVNSNHALIAQFDGSATSSGSMDLQTAKSAADGSFAFTLSGVNSSYFAVGAGGVFSISNGNITGTIDMNEPGGLHLDNPITGTITSADSVGRGQIIGFNVNGIALALNYYVVGPEVIRIIDVDPGTDPSAGNVAVGSAFGQGSGSFSNASLKNSVFAVQGNPWTEIFYAGTGMIVPNAGTGEFTGVADENEEGSVVGAAAIFGTYTIGANGYGSLLITSGGLQDVTSFGLYATDPNLNLLDPNNTTGGGGALFLDLDPVLASGSGVVIPQTDSAANSFSGNYAFGAQDYNSTGALGYEFDYVGEGAVVEGVLTGTGAINDSFGFFSSTAAIYNAVPFSGTAAPDVANPGRYTMAPLDITAISGSKVPFSMAIYQASGGLLFWIDEDASSLSFGTLQQEKTASQVGRHSKKKLTARTQMHHKRH